MRSATWMVVFVALTAAESRGSGGGAPPPAPVATGGIVAVRAEPDAVRNLEAFARLYGYVRWFHPSDEAAAVDWDRLAVLGAERVRDAADDAALRRALTALFSPVAPTLRIYRDGETPAPVPPAPEPASRWQTIAWQHLGLGGGGTPMYESARTHRPHELGRPRDPRGTVMQSIAAAPLRGRRVRLRAAVRAEIEDARGQAQLTLSVKRTGGRLRSLDDMWDRAIRGAEWKVYEISGEIATDAESLDFGCSLAGQGKALVDAFEISVQEGGAWFPVEIANPGFEVQPPTEGWRATGHGYRFAGTSERPYAGRAALVIAEATRPTTYERLFDETPALGEAWEGELVSGVRARVPLAVLGDNAATWPRAGEPFAELEREIARLDPFAWTGADWRVRVAAVVIAWNVYQHFYPYLDAVQADWPNELRSTLRSALADIDAFAFEATLQRLVATARDGHGSAYNPRLDFDRGVLPCLFDVIEGKVVVTAPDSGGALRRGDVVEAVDGTDAMAALAAQESLRSGTPQWRQVSGLWFLGSGRDGTLARLRVERGGNKIQIDLPRGGLPPESGRSGEPVARMASGIWYVDLTRAPIETIRPRLFDLAVAPAVVFDMRGYPQDDGAKEVLQHLSDHELHSAFWQTPRILFPNQQRVSWRITRWDLPSLSPRLRGKIAFLTGPSAISAAESILGVVEAYRLAEIVGATTAGTNGNINTFALPGGYRIRFTGMRVLKHDGSQHHLIGIRPTIAVERTIAGMRAGRDEVLEAALRALGVPAS